MPNRYDRQLRLPEIGETGQFKLLNASVLCIGAGGLGSPALLYLAAAGVGKIGIIDFDKIDESNLQRQILFDTDVVGQSKAEVAAKRLRALNPMIEIKAYDGELNNETALQLFPEYDIILDGTDNFEAKFLINDAAVKFNKPWIYGAIQGFDGQVSVFNYSNGPCYRCLYPGKPRGRIMNCAEAGVIGAVAGIIGVTQALQAIQIIADHENFEPLAGKLMTLDTRTMSTRILTLKKDPACPVCSKNRDDIVLSYASPICGIVQEISVEEMGNMTECILMDVRESNEWDRGYIEGARLYPLSKIINGQLPDISKDTHIIIYCQKGMRSRQAAKILHEGNFLHVYSLAGGFEAWTATR